MTKSLLFYDQIIFFLMWCILRLSRVNRRFWFSYNFFTVRALPITMISGVYTKSNDGTHLENSAGMTLCSDDTQLKRKLLIRFNGKTTSSLSRS